MNRELEKAAMEGDVDCFITILEKLSMETEFHLDTILEQTSYNGGNTYLHLAVKSGGYELIGLLTLISDESLMTQANNESDTALHMAVKLGHWAVTDLLIRHGQELFLDHLYVTNNKGNTPLHEALIHNHQHLVDLLLQFHAHCSFYVNNEGKFAFYFSVETGNMYAFDVMLKQDFWTFADHMYRKLDEQLMKGRSLLHAAIARQDKVMLQKILAKRMHMLQHVKDEKGLSPIEFASRIGFDEGVKILRDELTKDTTITTDAVINQQVLNHNYSDLFSSLVEVYDEELRKD
ncbi:uncharacterized protein [Rutidosis leptorrhynchoides]|uniref:uncharacterized protein n=1 Tax=Rutidosis leptorrhynchoides TaxID=125765 RepID=UPI003A99E1B7